MDKETDTKLILGKDIPLNSIANKMCLVHGFIPLAKIENGKLIASKVGPYAFLTIEPEKPRTIVELFILHKIDFQNLWKAFIERKRNENEEIIIVWSNWHKNRFLKVFGGFLPKLGVYVYPRGFFENKWTNPEWHRKEEFSGEAGFNRKLEEVKPIASWKSDVMDYAI